MSTCCLGDSFDIHGGGHDLQFPHHENEIAQSEGATGRPYAKNWLHVGFVNVDGEKMSKSLNNFFTIRQVLEDFHAETIRFLIVSSHYRSPINFSDTALKEAHSALTRLYHALKPFGQVADDDNAWQSEYGKAFSQAMNDDFNTAQALSVLFELAGQINKSVKAKDNQTALRLAQTLKTLGGVLNIAQADPQSFLQAQIGTDGLSEAEIVALIEARKCAKANKDFQKADQIRADLRQAGIELEDSREGTTWRRV